MIQCGKIKLDKRRLLLASLFLSLREPFCAHNVRGMEVSAVAQGEEGGELITGALFRIGRGEGKAFCIQQCVRSRGGGIRQTASCRAQGNKEKLWIRLRRQACEKMCPEI